MLGWTIDRDSGPRDNEGGLAGQSAPAQAGEPRIDEDSRFRIYIVDMSVKLEFTDDELRELTLALDEIWQRVRRLNRYVEEQAPWQLAKDEARADDLDLG